MRFDLQPSVLCLTYQHPLLLERCRGWTPKIRPADIDYCRQSPPANLRMTTPVESWEISRFEGEGGAELSDEAFA